MEGQRRFRCTSFIFGVNVNYQFSYQMRIIIINKNNRFIYYPKIQEKKTLKKEKKNKAIGSGGELVLARTLCDPTPAAFITLIFILFILFLTS